MSRTSVSVLGLVAWCGVIAGLFGCSSGSGSGAAAAPLGTLAFTQQPAGVRPFAVRVTVRDASGTTVTSSVTVTLAIGTNPTGATLSAGPAGVSTIAGIATFSNLVLDRLGTGFTLVASSPGFSGATSAAFNSVPELGVPVAVQGVTTYGQAVVNSDPDNTTTTVTVLDPLEANSWDVNADMNVNSSTDNQWGNGDFAVGGTVTRTGGFLTITGGVHFQADQTYSELVFLSPLFSSQDGVVVAAVSPQNPIAPTQSALLLPISSARLQQTVNLTGVTQPVSLTWSDDAEIGVGRFSGEPLARFAVVIRDASGNDLFDALPATSSASTSPPDNHTVTLPATLTGQVTLSFELRSTHDGRGLPGWVKVDNVGVRGQGGAGANLVVNGDFERGDLTGWVTSTPQEVRSFEGGVRNLGNLRVVRSFYTSPTSIWARGVDLFINTTTAAISTTAEYLVETENNTFFVYAPAGMSNQAVAGWDTAVRGARDIGFCFGTAASVTFTSVQAFGGTVTNQNMIGVTHSLVVPPNGGEVAIVHFWLQSGVDTRSLPTTHDVTARAALIESAEQAILNNFRTDPQYMRGMTQEQINAIGNF